jgi:hypothetical protein
MADIEQRLRAAMHAAVDSEYATADQLIGMVRRRHRQHNARIAWIAILVVLALAVPTVLALRGGLPESGPPLDHGQPRVSQLPIRMSGLPMPRGTNFQFLITTTAGAGWYSAATGHIEPIAGLPPSSGGYEFQRAAGGWVLEPYADLPPQPQYVSPPCPPSQCAGDPAPYYFVADSATRATRIGLGYSLDGLCQASRAGALWLVTYPQLTSSLSDGANAQLVSTTGTPLGPVYRTPGDQNVDRAVGNYLLLTNSTSTEYELWDPVGAAVIRSFPNVIAAGPEQVVWSTGDAGSMVQVTNVGTGTTTTTQIPGADPAGLNAIMSDDGQLLAVELPGGQLAVLNTVTGILTDIQGTAVSTSDWQHFEWQDGGHRLLITAGPNSAAPAQVAYWQPGQARLFVAAVKNQPALSDFRQTVLSGN